MREIPSESIAKAVAELAVRANCVLPEDVCDGFRKALRIEPSPVGRDVL